jgi:hypothetical protein
MDFSLNVLQDPILNGASRAVLSIVLLFGGFQKLREPVAFRMAIENYGVVPRYFAPVLAFGLPVVELILGGGLLLADFARLAAVATVLLLVAMTAVVAVSLMKGRYGVDCGCGGLSSLPLSWWVVGRNCVLVGIGFVALHSDSGRTVGWLDLALTTTIVLAAIGMYLSFNQLMTNAPFAANLLTPSSSSRDVRSRP